VQEKERLEHEKSESTYLVSTTKHKRKKRKKDEAAKVPNQKKPKKSEDCFFYKNVDT